MAYKTVFEASKTKAYKWGFSEIELPDSRIYTSEDGKVEQRGLFIAQKLQTVYYNNLRPKMFVSTLFLIMGAYFWEINVKAVLLFTGKEEVSNPKVSVFQNAHQFNNI